MTLMKQKKAKHFLRQARLQNNLTLEAASAQLARRGIELSPGQLSRLERSDSTVSHERLVQLGALYDWTPAELLAGRGLDDDQTPLPRARMLPLINRVQAGHWTDVADPYLNVEPIRWVPAPSHVGPRAFVLEVSGPSMEPEFHDKDLIVVDPDVPPSPGNYVVACLDDNEATFKRYRVKAHATRRRPEIELVPLNPDWPVLLLQRNGRIIGVATDHMRRLV